MKALELTVYPRDEDGDYFHPGLNYFIPDLDVEQFMEWKRLTDAELAAEYYREGGEWAEVNYDRKSAEPISRILHRFATHPHHDEETR